LDLVCAVSQVGMQGAQDTLFGFGLEGHGEKLTEQIIKER